MKLERLNTLQRLPVQIEEAWEYFTSPKNFRLITPPWLDFRLISDPPESIHPGAIVAAQIRPVPGISMKWISEITHIRPPHFYISEQRFGPFKMWHHEHYFRVQEDGIEMEDVVIYGLHLGPLGSLAHDIFVREKLHEIFTHRARAIEQRFGTVQRSKPRQASPAPVGPPQISPAQQPTRRQPPPGPQPVPRQRRPQSQPDPMQRRKPGAIPDRPITLDDIFGAVDD